MTTTTNTTTTSAAAATTTTTTDTTSTPTVTATVFYGATAPSGEGLLIVGVSRLHSDTLHSLGSARLRPDNT